MVLKNPTGTNLEFIRNYTKSVDGSGIYPQITFPDSFIDIAYGAIQIEFRAIREAGSGIIEDQDYYLYGGKFPYNVYAVNSLPVSSNALFPVINKQLVSSGATTIPAMSGYKFTIQTIGGETDAYRISVVDENDFGITRFEFYDFEGENREAIDFILNPEIRNISGIIVSDLELTVGSGSIDLSYYAGLTGDENLEGGQSKIFPIIWDVVDGASQSVVGSGVTLRNINGPTTTIVPIAPGNFTLIVSREQESSPEQTSPYLLRDHIIAEAVNVTLSGSIPLVVLSSGS